MAEKNRKNQSSELEDIQKVKIPRGREVIGVIDQRLGASRMRVKCLDGKTRICRVPGRMKRKLWVREQDVVLIEPWEYGNEKGDIIFKYKNTQISWLQRKGYIKSLEELEEF